ncbi:DUF2953 domain-containing protein [Fictibacillus aquaticus]|nr:DUF2953 domain-containing protein [Fictibacillus aquaticus]
MYWIAAVIIFSAILLTGLWVSRISVSFEFTAGAADSSVTITFRLWKIFSHTKVITSAETESGGKVEYTEKEINSKRKQKIRRKKISFSVIFSRFKRVKAELKHIHHLASIAAGFLKNVKLYRFRWETVIGTGDASSTAVMSGLLWSVKGIVNTLLYSFLSVQREPHIEVHPVFSHAYSKTHVSGMFSFRIGHAIVVMLRVTKAWRKSRSKMKRSSNAMTGGFET